MESKQTEALENDGFFRAAILTAEDFLQLRDKINRQIRDVVKSNTGIVFPDDSDCLLVYNEVCSDLNHGDLWSKKNRMLSAADTKWFENTVSFRRLKERLNVRRVSDEENLGRSNFYWRLTRPNVDGDIGPYHRDEWFWKLNKDFGEDLNGLKRIKVWIAVQTEQGLNGLLIQRSSHLRKDLEYEVRETNTIKKPSLTTNVERSEMELVDCKPGEGIIFHDKLLHGGALNQGSLCRCSIEFTFIVDDCISKRG